MNDNRKNTLVYPRKYFVEDIVELKKNGEKLNRLILHQTSEINYWLVGRRAENSSRTDNQKTFKDLDALTLNTILLNSGSHPGPAHLATNFLNDAHLYVEIESQINPNRISGYVKHQYRIFEIDELFLVGAEMLKIPTINSTKLSTDHDAYENFLESDYARERWQMSIKALGKDVWKRLCQLKIMIVGAGRSGETAALELARLGAGYITICDGDILERRNMGEMKFVTDGDIGRNKAEVVVDKITKFRYTKEKKDCFKFRAIKTFNFDSYEAQKAAEESNIIICCVDSDGGRGYASYLAARFYKVLLDIGTGILAVEQNNIFGYGVRLILPDDGCLRCCGGIDEKQSEIEILNRREQERQRQQGHRDRAGSLSALNVLAVNEGILMLQDLCKGEIKNSTWIQFEKNTGRTILSSIPRIKQKCDCRE